MNNKEHLTIEGLRKIVAIKASMNMGLSDVLKSAFPAVIPAGRPKIKEQEIKDPGPPSGGFTDHRVVRRSCCSKNWAARPPD